MKITKVVQSKIYKILVENWNSVLSQLEPDLTLGILNSIWNLQELPSEDNRYENAYEDTVQHYYRNDDWSTDYLFQERFKVLDDSDIFLKFVIQLLDSRLYSTYDRLTEISTAIDYELNTADLRLITIDYNDEGFPVFEIKEIDAVNSIPTGVKRNNIPFYVYKAKLINTNEPEYFVLHPNKGWNDFSIVSIFSLNHIKNGVTTEIGNTKIIHSDELKTWEHLPDKFLELNSEFCSLSSDEEFYLNLKQYFGLRATVSILFALQDAAYFVDIHERFNRNSNFTKSLLRIDEAERLIRQLRPILHGANLDELYNFSYDFKPAYADVPIKISLNFNDRDPLPDRIFAVIGKNGTGKTQLMNGLPSSLSKGDPGDFYNKIPSFSKIIAVSYSVFDNFDVPKKNVNFNYVYCGLKGTDGDMRNNKSLVISFHNNWKKISEQGRLKKWRSILNTFIDTDIVNELIIWSEDMQEYEVKVGNYHKIKNKLSSGQSILLYIITQVIANIRYDSLILYDEPETHLHPNAITALMNMIYELVDEFESFCLIATHSPLIIRELFSKNVYIMNRHRNLPSFNRIGIESFGENLGILTDEVFGDRNVSKKYKSIINKLIGQDYSFDQIVDLLQFDDVPLSLNAKIYIRSLIDAE